METLSATQRNLRSQAVETATFVNALTAGALQDIPEAYREALQKHAADLLAAVAAVNAELDREAFGHGS